MGMPLLTTESGFRLIPAFTIDHNARRLQRHARRLAERERRTASGRKFALRLRRLNARAKR